jgi:hypothetical protein
MAREDEAKASAHKKEMHSSWSLSHNDDANNAARSRFRTHPFAKLRLRFQAVSMGRSLEGSSV